MELYAWVAREAIDLSDRVRGLPHNTSQSRKQKPDGYRFGTSTLFSLLVYTKQPLPTWLFLKSRNENALGSTFAQQKIEIAALVCLQHAVLE